MVYGFQIQVVAGTARIVENPRVNHVVGLTMWMKCFCAPSALKRKGRRKMSKSPSIYLAGGMEKAGEYGSIWRLEITPHLENLGYDVWNPYTQELNVGIDVKKLRALKDTDYESFVAYSSKIVDYDIAALQDCAAVAVRIDESVLRGAGTYGEITVCRLYNIPVYAWIDLPNGKLDVPAWAMGCLTKYTYGKSAFYEMIPHAQEGVCDY